MFAYCWFPMADGLLRVVSFHCPSQSPVTAGLAHACGSVPSFARTTTIPGVTLSSRMHAPRWCSCSLACVRVLSVCADVWTCVRVRVCVWMFVCVFVHVCLSVCPCACVCVSRYFDQNSANLVRRALQFDPAKRISAKKILQHPWLAGSSSSNDSSSSSGSSAVGASSSSSFGGGAGGGGGGQLEGLN
jgi:uncharacterized membrane protein YgcG